DAGISKKEAGAALKAVTSGVSGALAKGDSLTLVGFGTFSVSARAARQGRNPSTGETIQIKASKAPKFKAGKTLKDTLN
ncbi:MAG: HU family DNA-binding protein, partial [bacterium]|nr:HU family DNA-binding protein [bacterium]